MISITAIHKTIGKGIPKYQPAYFFDKRGVGSHLKHLTEVRKGRYGGTYAPQVVASAYTQWIEGSMYSKVSSRAVAQREHGALCAIEQLLGITLKRQYTVDKYSLDGYHAETNTAYEIDEEQHFANGELKQECKDRQAYIENKLGCKFVRIKV